MKPRSNSTKNKIITNKYAGTSVTHR